MPLSVSRRGGFNYGGMGVLKDSEWGCAMELLSLHLTDHMEDCRVNHSVRSEDVERIGQLAEEVGFRISNPLQSFGKAITPQQWEDLRKIRNSS